jgi:hypothetical protein
VVPSVIAAKINGDQTLKRNVLNTHLTCSFSMRVLSQYSMQRGGRPTELTDLRRRKIRCLRG